MNKDIPRIGGGLSVGFATGAYAFLLKASVSDIAGVENRITMQDQSGKLKITIPQQAFPFIADGDMIAVTLSAIKAALVEPDAPPSSIIIPKSAN